MLRNKWFPGSPTELRVHDFWATFLFVPITWLILYGLAGSYQSLYKKSRLAELGRSFLCIFAGSILAFLFIFLQDGDGQLRYAAKTGLALFALQLGFTFTARWVILNIVKWQMLSGRIQFPTLLISHSEQVAEIVQQSQRQLHDGGFVYKGYLSTQNGHALNSPIPMLGDINELEAIIDQQQIKLVVLGLSRHDQTTTENILSRLAEKDVEVKLRPDTLDILSGSVKTINVLGAPLINFHMLMIPEWQAPVKRLIDVMVATVSLLILSPVMLYALIRVRLSSPGPLFYTQERIGFKGKPFRLIKFRSMVHNAEPNGPALSSDHDPRITKWGKVMRKWRLDELPQFWNILRGDMSLVGPRPERKYYINQIIERFPAYKYLQKVKPGITSWGMVQFGYAENVDQMVERLNYDLLYLENMSLFVDLKIIIYTLITVFRGRGV